MAASMPAICATRAPSCCRPSMNPSKSARRPAYRSRFFISRALMRLDGENSCLKRVARSRPPGRAASTSPLICMSTLPEARGSISPCRIGSLFPEPIRHGDIEPRASGSVDIHISCDVDAARPGGLDRATRFRHEFSPSRRISALEMKNLDLYAGLLADFDGFIDGLQQLGALVAHMAGIDAAIFHGHAREFDQILRALKAVGRVDQCSRNAHGAGAHGLSDMHTHCLHLFCGRFAGHVAHDLVPGLRAAVVRAEI